MRLVGYDRAPARLPRGSGAPAPSPEALADRARDALAALGLTEIVSWGFVPRPWLAALGGPLADGVALKNPISADYEVMRTSLLPGLVDAARRNLARSVPDVGLFEVGPVVRRAADPKERPDRVADGRGASWSAAAPGWLKPASRSTSSTLKQVARELLRALGRRGPALRPGRRDAAPASALFHPGVAAEIRTGGDGGPADRPVGEIHPRLRRTLGLEAPRFYLEVALDAIAGERRPVRSVAPAALPGLLARPLVLDRRGRHRRPAAGAARRRGRAAAARSGRPRGLPRPALRAPREEGDALDVDLPGRRPDADRRRGRRGPRQDRGGAQGARRRSSCGSGPSASRGLEGRLFSPPSRVNR